MLPDYDEDFKQHLHCASLLMRTKKTSSRVLHTDELDCCPSFVRHNCLGAPTMMRNAVDRVYMLLLCIAAMSTLRYSYKNNAQRTRNNNPTDANNGSSSLSVHDTTPTAQLVASTVQ